VANAPWGQIASKEDRPACQVRDDGIVSKDVDSYIAAANKKRGEFLFGGRRGRDRTITTRQYARLVCQWMAAIGLDPNFFGTHSLGRTYLGTSNLRAVQLLLGHKKVESTVRYLGIEVDDALAIAEQLDV
jgi:integrase